MVLVANEDFIAGAALTDEWPGRREVGIGAEDLYAALQTRWVWKELIFCGHAAEW
jgi:hypothetical protein